MTDSPLYVSTSCLPTHHYIERLNILEKQDVSAVELGYCPARSVNLGSVVEEYPFNFIAHNYFLPVSGEFIVNLASPDDKIRQRSISYVKDGIDFCARHDIERYTIHAGFRVDPDTDFQFEIKEMPSLSRSMETFVHALERVLQYAESQGVRVGVENNVVRPHHVEDGSPVVLLSNPEEVAMLINCVDVDLLLDIGHLNVAANTLDFDQERFLSLVAPHVCSIHLHTNDGKTDQHNPVDPGDWALSVWERFSGVETTVEAQFDEPTALTQHLSFLQNHSR
jgi:sugar phosphate isomerase/epimerase